MDLPDKLVGASVPMLELLLASLPVRVYWKDRDSKFLGCNQLFAKDAGLVGPGGIVGLDDHAMPWKSDAESLRAEDAQVMDSCEPRLNREKKLGLASGNIIYIRYSKVPMQTEAGEVSGLLCFYQDITEEIQAQDDLSSYSAQMNSHFAEMELKNLELDDALVRAEVATKAKGEFLAMMSHEIRTPMNGVLSMTEILLDTVLTKEQRDFAETVYSSGSALLGIINDILDYSKIEAGKMLLEEIDFDLRVTGESVLELLAFKARENGNELIFDMPPELDSWLLGDPGKIRQILMNLVGNACKFTKNGEIVLRISSVEEDSGEVVVTLAVSDSGIGIPGDKLDLLFESFSQVDSSTSRKYGGTGLGLTICKQLCEMMGGKIGVESELGKGSTFWVTAHLGKGKARQQPEPLAEEDLKGKRILVVDNSVLSLQVIARQLDTWGLHTSSTTSGNKALRILEQQPEGEKFDIALLENQMPGMTGDELAQNIKTDPRWANLPLVMITACGQKGDAARMKEAGFNAYLSKPLKQAVILDCLRTVLGLGNGDEELQAQSLVTKHSLDEAARNNVAILLAEDNPVNQKVAIVLLSKQGYKVDVANNGIEALEAVKRKKYDLVLMDCMMPEMDGYEATGEIRKLDGEVSGIPIIAMTAHAMEGDREKCLAAGMDDYVTKPINRAKLFEAIDRQVQKNMPDGGTQQIAAAVSQEPDAAIQPADIQLPMDIPASITHAGDQELWDELIVIFDEETEKGIKALASAISEGDAGLVEREAHTIKGGSAEMLAEPLREAAFELEMIGKSSDLGDAMQVLSKVQNRFNDLRKHLAESGKV